MHWRFRASPLAALALCLPLPVPASTLDTQAQWHTAIRQQLQRQIVMPSEIRDAKTDLKLQVRIVILSSGAVEAVTLAQSSGNNAVDKATLAMIRRAGRLPAFTHDMAPAKQIVMLPVRYVVAHGDAPAPPAPATATATGTKQTTKTSPH